VVTTSREERILKNVDHRFPILGYRWARIHNASACSMFFDHKFKPLEWENAVCYICAAARRNVPRRMDDGTVLYSRPKTDYCTHLPGFYAFDSIVRAEAWLPLIFAEMENRYQAHYDTLAIIMTEHAGDVARGGYGLRSSWARWRAILGPKEGWAWVIRTAEWEIERLGTIHLDNPGSRQELLERIGQVPDPIFFDFEEEHFDRAWFPKILLDYIAHRFRVSAIPWEGPVPVAAADPYSGPQTFVWMRMASEITKYIYVEAHILYPSVVNLAP